MVPVLLLFPFGMKFAESVFANDNQVYFFAFMSAHNHAHKVYNIDLFPLK